jgi:hypothetical protein
MSQVAEWEKRFSSPMLDPQRWIASYTPASMTPVAPATNTRMTMPS